MTESISDLPNYDRDQQIFCLSLAANAAGGLKATTSELEAGFKKALDHFLPQITPKNHWKTAWGPAVFKTEPNAESAPVNSWFVAQNDDHNDPILVVAVAGTAKFSVKAWAEDFDVENVVKFDDWTKEWKDPERIPEPAATKTKSGTLVSEGTCHLVHNILSTPSPHTGAKAGTYLGKFLKDFQADNPSYRIVFTGHSLGGAVAPALALGLVQSFIIKLDKVSAAPSAGASPGNAVFLTRFSSILRGSVNYYNTLDVVPQAWCTVKSQDRNLYRIPDEIYAQATFVAKRFIKGLSSTAIRRANRGTQYIGLPGEAFTGRGIPSGINIFNFEKEALFQHVNAYILEWKITDFWEAFVKFLESQKGIIRDAEIEHLTDDDIAEFTQRAAQFDADEADGNEADKPAI